MKMPSPHNFSRSPVDEVYCACIRSPEGENLELTIPAPYPGWSRIRDQLSTQIATISDPLRISGCTLRFTDRFPSVRVVPTHDFFRKLMATRIISEQKLDNKSEFKLNSSLPGTMIQIISIGDGQNNVGWTLVFILMSDPGACLFSTHEKIQTWFDEAHAEIHLLFDMMVPPEIIEQVR